MNFSQAGSEGRLELEQESEDGLSLPNPPPPRPAARREAIEAALRKFDGIEEPAASRQPASRPASPWRETLHRRPAGALVAVALIAVVAIPAMQIALRDNPPAVSSEDRQPAPASPRAEPAQDRAPTASPAPAPNELAVIAEPPMEPHPTSAASPSVAEEARQGSAPAEREEKAGPAARSPSQFAPPSVAKPSPPVAMSPPPPAPPPPPPPPAAEPQVEAETGAYSNIVVTGSRVRRPNLESAAPVTVIDPYADFLTVLQESLRTNDRRAVIRLVALPLTVITNGETRTYRSSDEIQRNYDRIFTPEVRRSARDLTSRALQSREGGRLRGNNLIWFGCGLRSCGSKDRIRIRRIDTGG